MRDRTGYEIEVGCYVEVVPRLARKLGVVVPGTRGRVRHIDSTPGRELVCINGLWQVLVAIVLPCHCTVVRVERFSRGRRKGEAKLAWVRAIEATEPRRLPSLARADSEYTNPFAGEA